MNTNNFTKPLKQNRDTLVKNLSFILKIPQAPQKEKPKEIILFYLLFTYKCTKCKFVWVKIIIIILMDK